MTSVAAEERAALDSAAFRQALGHFLTGVTVATTLGPNGEPVGMTANAFTSVSLDPPLILFCLARSASSFTAMQAAERFAVHILGAGHEDISNRFARSAAEGVDKFAGIAWSRAADGLPLLDDYLARLECTIAERVEAGDHVIYIGRVDDAHVAASEGSAPLGFFRGRYAGLVAA